jgi:hypothetical protein
MINTTCYMPFLSDEPPFCDIFTCAEFASWVCYPQGVMTRSIMLCNQHKREREREERESRKREVDQIEADVGSVLQDVDLDDAKVLWERCSQVLDAIHEDRL